MNAITRLKAENEALRANVKAYAEGLAVLRKHVDSYKFKGNDLDGSRKDWMATADVLRWISIIENDATDPVHFDLAPVGPHALAETRQ